MIVETYNLDGTLINIHDDFFPKDEEEKTMRKEEIEYIAIKILKETKK